MTSIKTKTILTFALSVTFLSACAHTDTTSAKPDMMAKSASASDKFDVKTLTCWDVLTVSEDDIDMAMMLVYGYAQGAKGMSAQSSLSIEAAFTKGFTFCENNPDSAAIDAF